MTPPGGAGSSPLTRGKLLRLDRGGGRGRLIPAHAGKTWPCASNVERKPAHPRSRGENVVAVISASGVAGSSPLTRGKPLVKSRAFEETRLIPAHAGKTPQPP